MAIKTAKKDRKLELRIPTRAKATDLKATDPITRREAEKQPSSVARQRAGVRNNILLPEEKEELNRDQLGSVKKTGITLYNNRDRYSDFIDQQINAQQARQNMLDFGDRLRANSITADPLTDREGYIQQVNTRRENNAYAGNDLRLMSTPQLKLNKAALEAEDNRAGVRNNILLPEEKEELNRDQLGSVKKTGITLYNNRDRYSDFIDQQINAQQARQNMLAFGDRMRANSITADPLTDREGYIQQVNTRRENNAYTGKDLRLMSTPQLKLNKAKLEAEDNRAAAVIAAKREAWENRTAEEKAADNARVLQAQQDQGKLGILATEGLPIGYTMYGRPYTLTDANGIQSLQKLKKRPEDYEENAYDYDRVLYDFIHGEGAYEERYDRDFDNLDREVSELWDKLENGTIAKDYMAAQDTYAQTVRENAGDFGTVKNAGEIERYQKEIDKRARVQEMEKNAPAGSGEYDPSRVSTTWAWVGGDLKEIVQGGEADELYWKINHPGEDLTMGIAEKDQTDPQKRIAMHPSDFMDDEQRKKFNQYFLNNDKEGALAYYKGLESTYLMPMYNQAQERVITKMSQNEYAPLMATERIVTQPVAGISGTIGAGLALLGNEEAKNPDSGFYRQGKINTQIQETRGKVWGKQFADWFGGGDNGLAARIGTMLNGVVYSMADNLVATGAGTALGGAITGNAAGKVAQGIVQTIMSSEATANTMREKLEDGMDPTKAAVYAFGDGTIEWFTEKYSVEQLLNPNVKEMLGNKKEFIRYMMKNFTAEGSEEVASDVLGLVFDEAVSAITGTDSEMAARYKELTKNHQRTDAQAKGILAREFGEKVLQSFVAGGLSGLLMSGARGEYTRIQERFANRSLGADIRSEGNTNTEGKTGEQQLIEVARGMKDPEAQQAGNALAEKAAEGKKISDAEVGRLARTVYEATTEQYQKTVAETVERRVAEQLKDKGVTEDAGQMAEIISKNLMEGSQPSRAEVKVLAKSEGAIALWQSYNTDAALAKGLAAEVRTETEGQRSIIDKIGDLASKRRPGTSAVAADVDKVLAAAKGDTKAAIGALRESRGDLVSEEYAEKMQGILEKDARAKSSKNFIDDAMKVRLAAMTLAESAPKVSMSEESAQELFQAARAEFDNKDAQRIIRQTAAEPGKGTATFDGAEYGTREWTEKTAGIQEGLRRQMRALGEIATRAGLRVNFINDAARSDINGYEMQDGSITINVASGMEHNMLTTMSHEMTHWLEQNSKEGYDALRSYILRTLRGKGQNVEEMAVRIIDNQNAVLGNLDGEDAQGLDLNGAMAEIVAQSCENLLSSQEMISELAQENPGVVKSIRNFVRRFTARIRSALKSMEGERGYDESISRQARALKDETEEIAKLWTAARREALGRSTEEGAEAQERTAYSVEQRTEEDTQDAQREGLDVPEMLRYSMVGAKARGGYAEQIARAKEMAAQGVSATQIFRETGALQGFRGNWWVSIDNQNIQLKDGYEKRGGVFSLREALEAPELLHAYPQLGSIQVKPAKLENAYGAYNREQNVIRLDRNMMRNEPEKLNVVLRHEIQHAIQGIEGTYGGANLQSWRDVIDKLHMRRASEVDLYDRTVGEIEANAASRGGRDSRRMPTRAQYANAVAIEDYMDEDGNVREPAAGVRYSMADVSEKDKEYAEAVKSGNLKKATDMLMDKLKHSENIIAFNAPHGYGGQHRDIARMIKNGTPEAIAKAVEAMKDYVPDNAVLIPMPPHEGVVLEDTDTMILARALGEYTGRPVMNALASNPRESRYKAKSENRKGITAEEMGFRQIAEIPEGTIPIFVDNVVGSGETAKAAMNALGGGITLAYAKGSQSPGIRGLKRAAVTFDKSGKLIPLSQRFDPNIRDVRYSTAEMDEQYAQAVRDGDEDLQQYYVRTAAERAGAFTNKNGRALKLYHGTKHFGFTEFDTSRTKFDVGAIFTTSNRSVANGYSEFGYDRGASSKYVEDDGTDKTIIRNARNVLNETVERLTEKKTEEIRKAEIEKYKALAEKEQQAMDKSPDYAPPEGIDSDFWGVMNAFMDIIEEDKTMFDAEDQEYSAEYRKSDNVQRYIVNRNLVEAQDRLKAYFNENEDEMTRLKAEGKGYYDLLFGGYEHGDGIIDMEYTYKPLIDISDKFIYTETNNITSREDLQNRIESEKDRGNYTLYGMPGDNPLEIDAGKAFWTAIKAPVFGEGFFSTDEIVKRAKAAGYTSVVIRNVMDPGVVNAYGDDYVFFNPNQLKSADPVVYDDQGNVIPLSERFNEKKKDIRFSLKEPVEERADGLVAVHNIEAPNLMKVLKLGGFAMPSIAVIRSDNPYNKYGSISVVFGPGTIDPQAISKNRVYGGDAWTPVFPSVEYKLSEKKLDKIRQKIKNMLPEALQRSANLVDLYEQNLAPNVNSQKGVPDITKAIGSDGKKWLRIAYMQDTGKKIEYPMKQASLAQTNRFSNDEVIYMANILGQELVNEAMEDGDPWGWLLKHQDIVEQIRTELNKKWESEQPEIKNERLRKLREKGAYNEHNYNASAAEYMIRGIDRYFKKGVTQAIDMDQLDKTLKETIDEEDFNKWVNNLFSGVIEKSGIRNNKDYYTNSGNPRSWEQLHDEQTLDNVVRIMREQADKGENAIFGQSAILARGTRDFKSLDEIRKHKDQLRRLSDEDYSEAKKKIADQFSDLVDQLADERESSYLSARSRVLDAIADAVYKTKTATGIAKAMGDWGFRVTQAQAQKIAELMGEIADLPTEYFEAKPKRAVGLDEIAKVIVPEGTDNALLDELTKNGILWDEYDGTDEDRLAKLNSVENVRFSVRDMMDLDVKNWMLSMNESSLRTEAEKEILRNFKGLEIGIQLKDKEINDLKAKIAYMETNGKDPDTKKMVQRLKVKLESTIWSKEQKEAKLARIVSSDGYGAMMKNAQLFFDNFQYGLTSAEAQEATLALQKAAEKINDEIRINREAAEELAKKDTVKALRKILGETTAEQAANDLRREFHSTWTRGEIQNFLEPIMLKMAKGEDFTQEVEDLAGILIESDSRNRYEGLEALRGLEIVIGHGMMQELKATDSSIKEMRARLAGTGIKIRAAKKVNGTWEASTLEQDIEDLREEYPGMPDFGGEKDALENFVSWVEGMKKASMGEENYDERLAETMAQVMQKAAAAAQGIYIPTEARAQKQVLALIDFVKSLRAETKQAVETLNRVQEQAVEIWKQSGKAAGMTSILTTGIADALEYYNKMAKIAVDEAKRDKNNRIIEQMKSEAAQKLYKSNEEWRQLIERDKEARGEIEKNGKTRNQIDTVIRRLYKLLKEPKGLKNVPEYMQGLAREVIGTLVESEAAGGRKITRVARKDILEMQRVLKAWEARDGRFNMADLGDAEEAVMSVINSDLMTLYDTLTRWNGEIKGKNRLDTVKKRGEILREMQEAINEIYTAIRREGTIQVNRREIAVEDQAYKVQQKTGGKKYREWTGKAGSAIRALHSAIVSGNMTPEYFFRSIGNEGLSELWENYHDAENRNGLELKKAQEKIAAIAEKHGYKNWDTNEKITLELEDGTRTVTLGQLMSMYATWKREKTLGPEMSSHLTDGGFYAEEDTREGFIGRQEMHKRPVKIQKEEFQSQIAGKLTEEQKKFVDDIVEFMSTDLSKLGNEASMAAYGIKMYKESYYFPFQMWDGIKSRKSNEGAGAAAAQDRAFHPSFSKSRVHGANNAIVIGDFMQTVADHTTGMINYATMGLANEMMQKVLNNKLEGQSRNTRTVLEEAYGREAMEYLAELQKQLNGGAVRASRSLGDKAITLFRKNAVAGSLSVAFQQPLSYIRAAMVINPKFMAQALMKDYWKGAYSEMTAHSGVAVIKDVGKFDMNAGQSAREYLMPEGYETKARRAWEKTTEYATILPELMDRWTWTRMWVAVKAEQAAAHPDMDVKSDEFLDLCGERFNEVMRRTQVYDSTLVRSANMRSDNYFVKNLTSFMAEPTLTLNVLADSVRAAVQGEKGGKTLVAKAAAVFLTSAVMQAAIKAIFSTGRTPDDKKTKAENFMARFVSNLIGEVDPAQLVPGYNDLVTLMKKGELSDDAMGAIGKMWTSGKGIIQVIAGGSGKDAWRDIEDSVGQLTQLFSGLPAKNIMRELRAMYNLLINPNAYADRETSGAVIKYQTLEALANADNLAGVLIQEMGEAGYPTKATDYYKRIYEAKKRGDEKAAAELTEFLTAGKGVKEKSIESGIKSAAKADESASAAETAKFLVDEGTSATDYIKEQLAAEELTAEEARKLLKEAEPEKDADSIWWTVDRIEYKKETGKDAGSGSYYRLKDAMEANKSDEIRRQVKTLTDHGKKKADIKENITKMFKAEYMEAGSSGKIKIRDAIQKAYKALGYTAADADKIIDGWTKKK